MALILVALVPAATAVGTRAAGAAAAGAAAGAGSGDASAGAAAPRLTSNEPLLAAALTDAAALYAMNCSVCHGPTGGGLAEARLRFPPDERNCSRCHKANNPIVQPLTSPFVDNDMFPVGNAPALHKVEGATADAYGADAAQAGPPLASVAAPQALFAYVKATMPRYDPGRHSDAEYWLLSAHLLAMNDRQAEAEAAAQAAEAAGWLPPAPGSAARAWVEHVSEGVAQ